MYRSGRAAVQRDVVFGHPISLCNTYVYHRRWDQGKNSESVQVELRVDCKYVLYKEILDEQAVLLSLSEASYHKLDALHSAQVGSSDLVRILEVGGS